VKLDLSNPMDRNRAAAYFQKLTDESAKIELKKFHPSKTLSQLRYLSVCYKVISAETGYRIDEVKKLLKDSSGDIMTYRKDGHVFYKSAADLDDTLEMTNWIDWIRSFGLDKGIYIATPEEYITNQFEIDKELNYVK